MSESGTSFMFIGVSVIMMIAHAIWIWQASIPIQNSYTTQKERDRGAAIISLSTIIIAILIVLIVLQLRDIHHPNIILCGFAIGSFFLIIINALIKVM
jgi:hypothetical protein